MDAESRMLEALKTMPARSGQIQVGPKLDLRFAMKPQFALSPIEPSVRPITSEKRRSPIT